VAGLTVVGGGIIKAEVLPVKPKVYTSPQGGDYAYLGHKCKHDADAADEFDRTHKNVEDPAHGYYMRWMRFPIEMTLTITYLSDEENAACIIDEEYLYLDSNRDRVRELAHIINAMHPEELFEHLEEDSELNARIIDGKQPYLNWNHQKIVLRGKPFRISMFTYRGVTS
jgi:hypothetical protein